MARRVALAFSSLSIEELSDLSEAAEGLLCSVLKIDPRKAALTIEHRMSAVLTQAWKTAATAALPAMRALAVGPHTPARITAALRALGMKLRTPITPAQAEVVGARVRAIYTLSKKEAARQASGKFIFGLPDARAVAATNRQQIFWVNGFYSEHLSARVSAVARDVLLEQGLTHREAGRTLMRACRQELGLSAARGASEFAASVPARYAGMPEFYFEQVASVAGQQARVFGRIRGFSDASIVTFQLINPMDERTGQICMEMHGQTFTVAAGVDKINEIVGARTPEEVRLAAPWLGAKLLSETLAGAPRGSREASDRLSGVGVMLPPFHPLCRTEPVIVT